MPNVNILAHKCFRLENDKVWRSRRSRRARLENVTFAFTFSLALTLRIIARISLFEKSQNINDTLPWYQKFIGLVTIWYGSNSESYRGSYLVDYLFCKMFYVFFNETAFLGLKRSINRVLKTIGSLLLYYVYVWNKILLPCNWCMKIECESSQFW